MAARQAEGKAMKMLEEAGIRGASREEMKIKNDKGRAASTIRSRKDAKFPESLTLASEVADTE